MMENRFMKKINSSEALQYITMALIPVVFYIIERITGLDGKRGIIKGLMVICLLMAVGSLVVKWRHKELTDKYIIGIIIFMGVVMRVGYMLYTPCNVRAQDLWEIDVNANGHAGYVLRLIENKALPDTNRTQLYQQPLFYFIGALVSKVINTILQCKDSYYLVDAVKTVSSMASCISILVFKEICQECGLKEKAQICPLMLMAFIPVCYLTGGRVNPDALAAMFMMMAFLYTLRWLKDQSWGNTLILAVIYGCAVMTKISSAVVAIGTAVLFLWKLYAEIKNHKNVKGIIYKYIVFAFVSLPLGLWYSIRNYILFNQPLGYVLKLSTEIKLYTGKYSLMERLFSINFQNLFTTPYAKPWGDYNAPVYYLKSSLFGEFTYEVPGWMPVLLMSSAALAAIITAAAVVWQLRSNRKDKEGNIAAGMAILFYCSELYFYIKYPFGCSMDFRYMIFLIAPLGVLLGKYMSHREGRTKDMTAVFLCFSIFSCIMYCFI